MEESRRNMGALREIASHLHGKTENARNRQGFSETPNEMESQIIRNLSSLEQQVYVLTEALQSSLQIIAEDHWRRTHKVERLFAWIRRTARRCEHKLKQNVFYRILAIASTLALLVVLVQFLIHLAQRR